MTTATQNTNANFATVKSFGSSLQKAAKAEQTAARKVLDTVVSARGSFDLESKATDKAVRETVQAVFDNAGTPSAKKRVADAMAVLKAPELPQELPGNLQRAADAIRAARPESQKRKPQADPNSKGAKASKSESETPEPVEPDSVQPDRPVSIQDVQRVLTKDIKALRSHAADDETVALLDAIEAQLIDG